MVHRRGKKLFILSRGCFRCFNPRYTICRLRDEASPAAYIVHHHNLKGPVTSMAWFDKPLHPWGLSVFFDQNICYRHYYDYTFTKRFGMPGVIAAILAYPVSFFISKLMRSMQGVPVYRGSRDVIKTFRESINYLISGESLLICPDIDYTSEDSSMGDMYKGFLNLEKYYMKQTGNHLAFIPLYINDEKRSIYIGREIYFQAMGEFKEERERVYNGIKEEFKRLEKL